MWRTLAKGLAWLALIVGVMILLIVGAVFWLGSESGRDTALGLARQAASAAGVELRLEGARGALGSELALRQLELVSGGTTVRANAVRLAWRPSALFSRHLVIDRLQVGAVEVRTAAGTTPPSPTVEPTRLPEAVELPVTLSIRSIEVGQLTIVPATDNGSNTDPVVSTPATPEGTSAAENGPSPPLRLNDLRATFAYSDQRFRLDDASLVTPWGGVDGLSLTVRDRMPYGLNAQLRFAGEAAGQPVAIDLRASGDAERLSLSWDGRLADGRAQGEALLRPLQALPAVSARLTVDGLDLQRFGEQLPRASIAFEISLDNLVQATRVGAGDPRPPVAQWQGRVRAVNAQPGLWPAGRLPLASLESGWALDWRGDPASSRVALGGLTLELVRSDEARAHVRGELQSTLGVSRPLGRWQIPDGSARLTLDNLDLASLAALASTRLSGTIEWRDDLLAADLRRPAAQSAAGDPAALTAAASLALRARLNPESVVFERLQLSVGEGALRAAGEVGLSPPYRSTLAGQLDRIRPAAWLGKRWPQGERWADSRLSAGFGLQGELARDSVSSLTLNITDSRLAGQPLAGLLQGTAHITDGGGLQRLDALQLDLRHGSDRWQASGALGQDKDELTISLRLGDLASLAPGLAGDARADARLTGRLDALRLTLDAGARRLRIDAGESPLRIDGLTLTYAGPVDRTGLGDQRFRAAVGADAVIVGTETVNRLSARLDGTMAEHRLSLDARAREHRLRTNLSGGLQLAAGEFADPRWRATLRDTRLDGPLQASQRGTANVRYDAQGVRAEGLDLALAQGRLTVAEARRASEDGRFAVRAEWRQLALGPLLAPAAVTLPEGLPEFELAGRLDLAGTGPADLDGRVVLELAEKVRGGTARVLAGRNRLEAELDAGQLGGIVELTLPSLAFTRRWTGADWQIDGGLTLAGDLSGPLTEPQIAARISGRDLSVLQPTMGWRLDDGSLRALVSGRTMTIESLRLASGEGSMTLSGSAELLDRGAVDAPGALPLRGRFELVSDSLEVPIGPGQRIVLSGTARFDSAADGMRLSGDLRADRGVIEIASSGAPSLPGDVTIVDASQPAEAPAPAKSGEPPSAAPVVRSDLRIDLGEQLRVVGAGVDARLGGQLKIGGTLPENPTVSGTVRLIEGSYKAYGQDLQVRRGNVQFNGPIDNPALDIVAVRPNLPVEVGVSISGNALNPVIEVFSSPNMSDAEKLSWLVLGAPLSDAPSAAQSLALRQAAMSLVGRDDGSISGGGLADKLGLENIGLGYASSTGQKELVGDTGAPTDLPGAQNQSSSGARDEVVTLAKRLSKRLLISYEQGVRGVWNLLRIQYEINDRVLLRAQTGSDSAVDLLYSFTFD
ncbi:MAG: translocation/assembly module TamB domain-containing protein [Burkholderiaceae bacterium]